MRFGNFIFNFFQQIEIVGIVVVLPVVAEHCARPGWLNRADPKGRCRIFDFMKFTHGKATIRFFFNGIRDIYTESSHPRRAEYGEKCCRKLAALKSNFMWSILVPIHDAAEFL